MGLYVGWELPARSISLIYRQLAVMFVSGASITEAFRTFDERNLSLKASRIINSIKADIKNNVPVEESLARYPRIFSGILRKVLTMEDQRKTAAKLLHTLADESEKTDLTKKKLIRSLYYPGKILIFAFFILLLLILYVIPTFQEIYNDFGGSLPGPTLLVFQFGEFIKKFFIPIILVAVILIVWLKRNKNILYNAISKIPLAAGILKKMSIISFIRNFSMALSLDIPVKEAINCSADEMDNTYFSKKIRDMAEKVQDIGQLEKEMESTGIFSGIVLQTIGMGAKTEELDYLLMELSKYFENDLDHSLYKFVNVTETFAILTVGLIIAFFVISMYLPIFQMAGSL